MWFGSLARWLSDAKFEPNNVDLEQFPLGLAHEPRALNRLSSPQGWRGGPRGIGEPGLVLPSEGLPMLGRGVLGQRP